MTRTTSLAIDTAFFAPNPRQIIQTILIAAVDGNEAAAESIMSYAKANRAWADPIVAAATARVEELRGLAKDNDRAAFTAAILELAN